MEEIIDKINNIENQLNKHMFKNFVNNPNILFSKACEYQCRELFDFLLDKNGKNFFYQAITPDLVQCVLVGGNIDIFKTLIDIKNIFTDDILEKNFIHLCSSGRLEMIKYLINLEKDKIFQLI